jgi:hypothetical protein
MNLVFGTLWLAGAVAIFGYGLATGEWPLQIRGLNISAGWLCLVLAAYNFVRFYAARAHKAEQESLRALHEARLREARHRERPAEYDPNFDFSDKPAPPPNG